MKSWWSLSVAAGAGQVLAGAGLLAAAAFLLAWADRQPNILELTTVAVAVRFFALSRAVLRYGERWFSHHDLFLHLAQWRVRLFQSIRGLASSELLGLSRVDTWNRIVRQVEELQNEHIRFQLPWLVSLISALIFSLCLALLHPPAALVWIPIYLIGIGLLLPVFLRWGKESLRDQVRAEKRDQQRWEDLVLGSRDLALAGVHERWTAAWEAGETSQARRLLQWEANLRSAASWAGVLQLAAVLALYGVLVLHPVEGYFQGPWFFALLLGATIPFEALAAVLGGAVARQRGVAAREDLDALGPAAPRKPSMAENIPSSGDWQWRSVCFSLPGFSLTIPDQTWTRGSRLVMIGESGSGKSTWLRLAAGIYLPNTGQITRGTRNLLYLEPDPHFFNRTLRENLLAPGADSRELREAIEWTELSDWFADLPSGWDTMLGQGGSRLSSGQRQRLALARLYLHRGRGETLLLDEPFAHLDPSQGARMLDRILKTWPDSTLVWTTHEHAPIPQDHTRIILGG